MSREGTQVEFQASEISSYTAPPGVRVLQVMAAGGQGGSGPEGNTRVSVGGLRAVLTGRVEFKVGETFQVPVGTTGRTIRRPAVVGGASSAEERT